MSEAQPIETAPKDGRPVALWLESKDGKYCVWWIGQWSDRRVTVNGKLESSHQQWVMGGLPCALAEWSITKWAPLPDMAKP